MIIYTITNIVNGKRYVGLTTKGLAHRTQTHKNCINSQKGINHPLYNSMKKYGFHNFKFEEIYCSFDLSDLCEKEKHFINIYKTTDKELGYNLSIGGEYNTPSSDGLKRISEKSKERWKNPDYRNNLIQKLKTCERKKVNRKGYVSSEQTKLKISKNRTGKYTGSSNHNYGKPGFMKGKKFTDDHKLKIAKALKGNKNTKTLGDHPNAKKILCIDTQEVFNSVSEAMLKYPGCNIYKAVRNNSKANGYKWKNL